jgi:cysteine synthase
VFLPETPEGLDTVELRIDLARRIATRLPNAITLLQYDNLANRETHYHTTGREIWRDTAGRIDGCVMAVGTCGTISGVGRALKEENSTIWIMGVEPVGSILFGGEPGPYLVQGGGLSFVPANLDTTVVDEGIKVTDRDSFLTARELARGEGISVGGTGGAVVFGARTLAERLGPRCCVVGVVPDAGDRYLDTFYSDDWLAQHEIPIRHQLPSGELLASCREFGCTVNQFGPSLEVDENAGSGRHEP